MKNIKQFIHIIISVVIVCIFPKYVNATLIFETATLGQTGVDATGAIINDTQWAGVRFSIGENTTVTEIGGHFDAWSDSQVGNGKIFGAIVALENLNDFPDTTNLTSIDTLGTTLLTLPNTKGNSEEIAGILSLPLSVGDYGLIFGSGFFGATGLGQLVTNNSLTGSHSFFVRNPNSTPPFFDTPLSNVRFFVNGDSSAAVPEPSSVLLLLTGLGVIVGGRYRNKN